MCSVCKFSLFKVKVVQSNQEYRTVELGIEEVLCPATKHNPKSALHVAGPKRVPQSVPVLHGGPR